MGRETIVLFAWAFFKKWDSSAITNYKKGGKLLVEEYANKEKLPWKQEIYKFHARDMYSNTQMCIHNQYKQPMFSTNPISQTVLTKYNDSYGLPENIKSLTRITEDALSVISILYK